MRRGMPNAGTTRVQYLYCHYRDQSGIYNYDSSLLQSDYNGLFATALIAVSTFPPARSRPASQHAFMMMPPPLNVFNVSVGQIYYFTESRTGDDNIKWENDDKTGSLVLGRRHLLAYFRTLGLRSGVQ